MNPENKTSIENFEPNVVAAFAYIFPPITGIIFFLLEKKSKFVRFHALQSVLFGAASYILLTLLSQLRVLYIGYLLTPFANLFLFGVYLLLLWKAYQGEEYQLPYIGKVAKENSGFDKKLPSIPASPKSPENN
jgi:uncharacterized membrane protein